MDVEEFRAKAAEGFKAKAKEVFSSFSSKEAGKNQLSFQFVVSEADRRCVVDVSLSELEFSKTTIRVSDFSKYEIGSCWSELCKEGEAFSFDGLLEKLNKLQTWIQSALSCSGMTVTGFPDDVLEIIIRYISDGHVTMRTALCSSAWKRLLSASPVWSFLWENSGYQLSEFRLKQLPTDLSPFGKYAVCAQAGWNLSQLRGIRVDLRADPDRSVPSNCSIRGQVNQCSPRYVLYSLTETINYSSYDSETTRAICIIDLQGYPTSVNPVKFPPWVSSPELVGSDLLVYRWTRAAAHVEDMYKHQSSDQNPFKKIPAALAFQNGSAFLNEHASFPWILFSPQRGVQSDTAESKGAIFHVESEELHPLPFAVPHGSGQDTFNGPYLAVATNARAPGGPSLYEIVFYKIDFENSENSSFLESLDMKSFAETQKVYPDRHKFAFHCSHAGQFGLFCQSNSDIVRQKWHLYTWDFSKRKFSLDEFVASAISLELPPKITLAGMSLDPRYAYISVSNHSIVIDHRQRNIVAVFRTQVYSTNILPIDSTCFLLNPRKDLHLIDLGLKGISTPSSLPTAKPSYAVLNLDAGDTSVAAVKMVDYYAGLVGDSLAHYLANTKLIIDGVPDPMDRWTVTYVLHSNFSIRKTSNSKTKDQFIHVLRKLEGSPNVAKADWEVLSRSDMNKLSEPAPDPKFGHSRGGVHRPSPATGQKLTFANEIVAIRVRTEKQANETIAYYAVSLLPDDALAAFKALKLI